ncbi:beta-lactamase-like protein [Globomyces pollinis-pini]|nr:beta-lactamase-like protein [Globomyces pollinis-pini]
MIKLVEKLTSRVVRLTSEASGPYSQVSYSYLVGNGPDRFLVDTGTGHSNYLQHLKKYLLETNSKVSKVFLTHRHHNHSSGFNLSDFTVYVGQKHPSYPKLNILKDRSIFKTEDGQTSLTAIHTPGHSKDHFSFWLPEEDVLFAGDSIISRPDSHSSSQMIYEDLDDFRASLNKMDALFPKLCFAGHGEVNWNVLGLLDDIKSRLLEMDTAILDILSHNTLTTDQIIINFFELYKVRNETDQFILQGSLRLHMLKLEKDGLIHRRDATKDNVGSADRMKKGPGGLTMEQIFQEIQKSRVEDYKQNPSKEPHRDIALHPLHSHINISKTLSWSVKQK